MSTATIGMPFTIRNVWSRGVQHDWTGEVREACDNDTNGYWYCLTCNQSPANNIGAARHTSHALVWVCIEHGPEVCPDEAAP